ncbi:family 3 adenylate cyclase [Microbispora sp. NEAU-D428]|uniref:family 3 adenylate cyclase n=1 Tax=Microbispora sitophila TaxID=2771537 RepID=UPI0018672434|nr:family 3 adenylate cyclase [Microbispora sitophila]MBE3011190.1 family 3 adenylate cyclase [Microbispora sitophila]
MSTDLPARHDPGAFDLARDAAPGLPLTLVERWRASGRTAADARRLLGAHVTTGYSVVSDSAGLTRLSRSLGLLEVLALIDGPKRVLHAYGTGAGGRAVGVWAADNAQMFHPASTGAGTLLSALLRAQDEIGRTCRIRVGIGVHHGDYYDLDGGLYGPEADAIEHLAENHTEGGEIAVTAAVAERLPTGHGFVLRRKDGHDGRDGPLGAVYRVLDGPRAGDAAPPGGWYPIPYPAAFYEDLLRLDPQDAGAQDAGLAATLAEKHLRERTVVLVERGEAGTGNDASEVELLRSLDLSARMREIGLRLLPAEGAVEVKVAGPLAIYLFDDPGPAVPFALDLRAALAEAGMTCRIGLDSGPVLSGRTPDGGHDVAGAPVNQASKMAQDLAAPGLVCLSEAVAAHADLDGFALVRHAVSGVDLTFYQN